MPTPQAEVVAAMIRRVNNGPLTVAELQAICRTHNIRPRTGRKDVLRERILARIHHLAQRDSGQEFSSLRQSIYDPYGESTISDGSLTGPVPHTQLRNSQASFPAQPPPLTQLIFKESPFYQIQEDLCMPIALPKLESSKGSIALSLPISTAQATRLHQDRSLRVLLYCAADLGGLTASLRNEVSFPNAIEIKIANGGEIKGSALKGIKNRPGSTKPADITPYLPLAGNKATHIQVLYGQTFKTYYVVAKLVRVRPVQELVTELRQGKVISVDSVYREMASKTKDSELETTSTVMSLKCPLSYMRIQLPCRSTVCGHNQCFDATSFLESQTQIPLWSCPVCSKRVEFNSLAVDQYVEDILQNTSDKVDNVTIEADGTWTEGARTRQKGDPSEQLRTHVTTLTNGNIPTVIKRRRSSDIQVNSIGVIDLDESPSPKKRHPERACMSQNEITRTIARSSSTVIPLQSAPLSAPAMRAVVDLTISDDEKSSEQDEDSSGGGDPRNTTAGIGNAATADDISENNEFDSLLSVDDAAPGPSCFGRHKGWARPPGRLADGSPSVPQQDGYLPPY